MTTTIPTLNMLAGPPGSGKSTKAHTLKVLYPDAIYISLDEFVERYARWCGKTYNEVFQKAATAGAKRVKKLVQLAKDKKADIIWDQTNLNFKDRKKKADQFLDYKKILHYTPKLSLDVLLEINKTRERGAMDEKIIKDMHRFYGLPFKAEELEYWDEIHVITRTN